MPSTWPAKIELLAEQAHCADHDQIDRDDVVQKARYQQDQDAGDQCGDRPDVGKNQVHVPPWGLQERLSMSQGCWGVGVQSRVRTTMRPLTCPAISRPAASIAPDSGTSVVIASNLAGSRSLARRDQACSRKSIGAITLSTPSSDTARRMNGATVAGKSMPCASPQAATAPR